MLYGHLHSRSFEFEVPIIFHCILYHFFAYSRSNNGVFLKLESGSFKSLEMTPLIDRVRVPIYLLCDCGHILYVIFHTPSTYLPRKTVANTFALLSTTEPDHTYRLVWMDSAKYPLCLLTAEGRYRRTDGQTDGKTISTAQYLLRNVTERSIKRLN